MKTHFIPKRISCCFKYLSATAILLGLTARADIAADYVALTTNLTTVTGSGGSPGAVVPYGRNSFPLFTGNADATLAVAAAGYWNDITDSGRGVAYAHDGWTSTTGSMGTALANAIAWAARNKTNAVIGIGPNTVDASFLIGLGYTVKDVSTTMTAPDDLSGVDVFLANLHAGYSSNAVAQTTNFLAGGGSVLVFAVPWALTAPELADANTIVNGLGLLYDANGYGSGGPFAVPSQAYPTYASALVAADLLVAHANGTTNLSLTVQTAAAKTVANLLAVQPLFAPLVPSMDALQNHYGWISVTKTNQLVKADKPIEATLAQYQSSKFDTIAPGALFVHPSASDFPGLPGAGSAVTRTVTINGNTPEPNFVNRGAKPTRTEIPLYAAPGTAITVTIPANLVTNGLELQIGANSDELFNLDTWPRFPKIARWQKLTNPVTQVGNVFGGLLVLLVPPSSTLGQFPVTFSNVLEAPAFILGQTTEQDWNNTIRNLPGATGFLQTSNITIHAPAWQLQAMTNPVAVATRWNDIMNSFDATFGYAGYRKRGEVIVPERQSKYGAAYADYPIILGWGWDSDTELNGILTGNSWGDWHEIGHTYQDAFSMAYTIVAGPTSAELDVNLEPFFAVGNFYNKDCWDTVYDWFGTVPYGNAETRLQNRSNFLALPFPEQTWDKACTLYQPANAVYDFYFNLAEAFGWQVYSNAFGRLARFLQSTNPAVTDPELNSLNSSDPNYKRNRFYYLFCEAAHRDLTAYFAIYGLGRDDFGLTPGVTNLIHSRGYEVWTTNRPPTSLTYSGTLNVSSNTASGTLLGTFTTVDPDPGNRFHYAIADGNEDGAFSIDIRSGQLRTVGTIDYQTKSNYSLTITVFDVAAPRYFLTNTVTVNVTTSPAINLTPTNIVASVSGGNLNLSWPADHIGWRLIMQTNNLAKGISLNTNDWATVSGSASTNLVTIPLDKTKPTEFYRLVFP